MPKGSSARRALILTQVGDEHAYAVAEGIQRKGGDVAVWHGADFPSRAVESVELRGASLAVHVDGPEIALDDLAAAGIGAVWFRRPGVAVAPCDLHPADRGFAESQCAAFRTGLVAVAAAQALWINPPAAAERAGAKTLQMRAAQLLGLSIPDTLVSNDPRRIRSFLRRHGGQLVYKPLQAARWCDQETIWAPFTSLITKERLVDDDLLQAVPGIYQEVIAKAYELRVTVMGQRIFAAKLRSQETQGGRLDWRLSPAELKIEPYELPPRIAEACQALLRSLGLVFGCFDLIVTPSGDYVFLEVNEQGQFLFVEQCAGVCMLDAFCELLMQARPDFTWDSSRVEVRLADVEDAVVAHVARARARHVPMTDDSIRETGSPDEAAASSDAAGTRLSRAPREAGSSL